MFSVLFMYILIIKLSIGDLTKSWSAVPRSSSIEMRLHVLLKKPLISHFLFLNVYNSPIGLIKWQSSYSPQRAPPSPMQFKVFSWHMTWFIVRRISEVTEHIIILVVFFIFPFAGSLNFFVMLHALCNTVCHPPCPNCMNSPFQTCVVMFGQGCKNNSLKIDRIGFVKMLNLSTITEEPPPPPPRPRLYTAGQCRSTTN